MNPIISGEHLRFAYEINGRLRQALDDVGLQIQSGSFSVLLGANGCGKTTLLKHFNALLRLQSGSLQVAGFDVADEKNLIQLRRMCGMVFQNPDNQFVSSVLEEDIAFGLRNFGFPEQVIAGKVSRALQFVGLAGYEKRAPYSLSGGQKQRAALAGVLVLEPELILLDEVTSMLDPEGRRDVLQIINSLHEKKKTIVMVTHYVEEALYADYVFLMKDGHITKSGTPRQILTDKLCLEENRLEPPLPVRMFYDLQVRGIHLTRCPLTDTELVEQICLLK
jgi:energy-coupling factor transport system ATP-binding protein